MTAPTTDDVQVIEKKLAQITQAKADAGREITNHWAALERLYALQDQADRRIDNLLADHHQATTRCPDTPAGLHP